MTLPNVWGKGGQLFAFSGMDGETNVLNQLVGSSLPDTRGIIFHTKPELTLSFAASVNGQGITKLKKITDTVVASDVGSSLINLDGKNEVELTWLFLDKDTILFKIRAQKIAGPVTVGIRLEMPEADREAREGALIFRTPDQSFACATRSETCVIDIGKGLVLATLAKDGEYAMFSFAQGMSGKDAESRAEKGLKAEFDIAYGKRMDFFRSLPELKDADERLRKTFAKCASVMKVNSLAPQGEIRFPWTTPDRWPHKDMWIWDSAFHGIGLRHFAHDWAENAIKAVLARQHEDGFIPHQMGVSGESEIIQPPILGWAAWKVYEKTKSLGFIEYCYPRIAKMVEWDLLNRDDDGNGLVGWKSGFASGMDNSPRFDEPWQDSVDLNCFIASEIQHLAQMAVLLEKKDDAASWTKRRLEMAKLINENLWDEKTGFYYDSAPDDKLIKLKTEAGFIPLFAGVCTKQQADSLIKHLTNPKEFWTPFPVASVAADEKTFSDNMWRGPVWINYNYLIIEGLKRYDQNDLAAELTQKTIDEIARWYEEDGAIYEFYDALAKTSPIHLHRKTKGGPKVDRKDLLGTTVCDYNWTAALFIDLVCG